MNKLIALVSTGLLILALDPGAATLNTDPETAAGDGARDLILALDPGAATLNTEPETAAKEPAAGDAARDLILALCCHPQHGSRDCSRTCSW